MFLNCSNIISLDLSNFITHLVVNMTYMFSGCKSLKYLNISNFDTSKVINMTQMFNDCRELKSLDLSNFYTPSLLYMSFIFCGCENLTFINLNNFDTSNVDQMKRVFYNCKSLKFLNLSSFNTSKVYLMVSMFNGCENLISLDLSSFNTKLLRNANGMFKNCKSITSLNLSHFITAPLINIAEMFFGDNNLQYLDISNFNTINTTSMKQAFQNCKSLVYLNLSNFDTSNVTDMTNMFKNCENLKYINLKNSKDTKLNSFNDIFTKTPEKMIFCIDEYKNQKLYDIIISDKPNSTINCSDNAYIYIPEKTIPINIDSCLDNNITIDYFKRNILNYITSLANLYPIIINGSDFLAAVLSSDDIKPEEQINKGISAIELGDCVNIVKQNYNISNEENLIIINIESKNEEIKHINSDNSFNLEKKTEIAIFDNSGNKLNISVCEQNIKIMKYIGDVDTKELDIKTAMNMANKGIDVFNPKDDFFNNICKQIDDINSKDMILIDRRKDIFKNATFCQNGCTYTGINYNLMVANCLCDSYSLQIIESSNSMESYKSKQNQELNFDSIKKNLLDNLFEFNIDAIKCYKLVFNRKILINNIGFYSMSLMFISQLIFLLIFFIKKLKPLKYFMLKFHLIKSMNIIIPVPCKSLKSIKQNILYHNQRSALNTNSNEKIKRKVKIKIKIKKKKFVPKLKNKIKSNIIPYDEISIDKTKRKLKLNENKENE